MRWYNYCYYYYPLKTNNRNDLSMPHAQGANRIVNARSITAAFTNNNSNLRLSRKYTNTGLSTTQAEIFPDSPPPAQSAKGSTAIAAVKDQSAKEDRLTQLDLGRRNAEVGENALLLMLWWLGLPPLCCSLSKTLLVRRCSNCLYVVCSDWSEASV